MSAPSLRLAAVELAELAEHVRLLLRLDRTATIRLRSAGPGLIVWSWVLDVLVSRTSRGQLTVDDTCVDGTQLAATCAMSEGTAGPTGAQPAGDPAIGRTVPLPAAVDARWPGAVPPEHGWELLDEVPGAVLAGVVRAGAETFRTVAANAALPERVGTALLDHVALTVSGASGEVGIPLRVLQALARTALLDESCAYRVELTSSWYRVAGPRGAAHRRREPVGLTLTPAP